MTLRLTLFSQEVDDFVMEIIIDANTNFKELHNLILKDCNYQEIDTQSFLICDEDWRVTNHIHLKENKNVSSEEDFDLMHQCTIGDFLEEEGQRLAYIFDPEGKRFLLMELTETIFGTKQPLNKVSRKRGIAPIQFLQDEIPQRQSVSTSEEDEEEKDDFYGDEGFEESELDLEGYNIE